MKVVLTNFAKKTLTCFLAIILAIPILSIPTTVYGATFNDIHGHWAESYINKAVSAGFVKGYPDRTFHPDQAVSRAEFTSMVNKALHNNGSTTVNFSDVPYNEWFYKDISKGISAGFVGGYNDNTFKPNKAVTREEAAAMVSRFVPTYGSNRSISAFKDKRSISTWATDAVAKIYEKGYMGAYNDGKYHPKDPLTRAQTTKILCSILDKENIVTSSTVVKKKGSTLSNRIYSNNVTLHSDLGSGDADLSNCVVLGTLYVYGGGENTVTILNSRVANAYVEKSSSAVRVLAKGQTTINKTTTGKTATLETYKLSGGLYGTGFNNVDIKSSADTTLKGSFIKVNVTGSSADVDIDSGSITTLNVTSYGRNSDIDVSSKANIGTANVNAKVGFEGSGKINTMNINSSGVTYETKPRYVKLGSGISSPDYYDSNYDIRVNPKHKETNVDVDDSITLTFDTAVTKYKGSSIRTSDIDDMVYIRKGSSSGSKISFSARISSNKKVITITPDRDLYEDTKYYIVIPKNEFYDTKNDGNDSQTTYFTTEDDDDYDSDLDIQVDPRHKEKHVDVDDKIKLTFDTAVTKYNGSSIRDSEIDDMIYIKRDSSSGHKISFSGDISRDKKDIVLTPDRDLDKDTKYYIVIPRNQFYDTRNDGNDAQTTYFTTDDDDDDDDIKFDPKSGYTNVSRSEDPTITFSESIETYRGNRITDSYLKSYIIFREGSKSGRRVSFDASYSSSRKRITIKPDDPLKEDQKYYLAIPSGKFRTRSDETRISSESVTWTTKSASAPTVSFSPSNGTAQVDLASPITLRFSSSIYDTSLRTPTDSYIKNYIILRNTTTNKNITYNLNRSGSTMILQPSSALEEGNHYTISISSSRFKNSSRVYLNSASASFTAKVNIDTSAIDTAISNANTAKSGVKTSNNSGSDIYTDTSWVTQAQWDALNNAITVATNAKAAVTTTAQAKAATDTLNTATAAFKAAKQAGNKIRVNTSALTCAIEDAEAIKIGIDISVDGFNIPPGNKWVTKETISALNKAITAAKSDLLTIDTSEQVVSYTKTLYDAVAIFKDSISNGNKSDKAALSTAINDANTKINGVRIQDSAEEVPVNSTWVTDKEYSAFSSAISDATKILQNKTALQTEVDSAVTALNAATSSFTPKDGKKGAKDSGTSTTDTSTTEGGE